MVRLMVKKYYEKLSTKLNHFGNIRVSMRNMLSANLYNKLSPKYDLLIVSLIGLVFSFAMSPSRTESLALTSTDDGPILPAIALQDLSTYPDMRISSPENSVILMWTTVTKWFPSIIYKYLGVDPGIFHTLFVYGQVTLILVGTYRLSRSLANSRETSFLSVGLVIIYESYFINMGAYGGQTFMPYTTWISVGPLLFSWANFNEGNRKRAFAYLFLGALVHPAMGLVMGILLLSISIFSGERLFSKYSMIEGFKFLAPAGIIGFLGTLPIRIEQFKPIPENWQKLEVFHWAAWNLGMKQEYFIQSKYALLFTLSILVLAIYFKSVLNNWYRMILIVSATTLISLVFQAFFYSINLRELSSINFSRMTIFSSIFLTIVAASLLTSVLRDDNYVNRWIFSSSVIFTFLFPSSLSFSLLAILLLLYSYKSRKDNSVFYRIAPLTILIVLLFLSNLFDINKDSSRSYWDDVNYFIPATLSSRALYELVGWLFIPSLLLILGSVFHSVRSKKGRRLSFAFVALLSLVTIFGRLDLSLDRYVQNRDWIDLQVWVKENSYSGETLLSTGKTNIHGGWTTLTRRYLINVDSTSAGNLYLFSKGDKHYELLRENLKPDSSDVLVTSTFEDYVSNLSSTFEARYLVSSSKNQTLSYPIVFTNSEYVIYKLR